MPEIGGETRRRELIDRRAFESFDRQFLRVRNVDEMNLLPTSRIAFELSFDDDLELLVIIEIRDPLELEPPVGSMRPRRPALCRKPA